MTVMTSPERPGMFSEALPALQIAWDATSFAALFDCPRRYQLSMLDGWRSSSVHLEFGGFVADALERYQKARAEGATREDAVVKVLRWLLEVTWNEDGTQWGGYWETQWKCDGSEPYRNAKGNRAKCPFAHKTAWFPPPPPADVCGECGGGVIEETHYVPGHKTKHRLNLARVLIWYAWDQPEDLAEGLHPYVFADGTPAVELSWRLPLGRKAPDGEDYVLCGHFDYIGQFGDEIGPVDNKTTGVTLSTSYFNGFSPSVQFDTYDMVCPILFPDLDFSWVAIDAIQVMVDTIRTGRHFYFKSQDQKEEHFKTLMWALNGAEKYAQDDYWPQNKMACKLCSFRTVCSAPAEDRESILKRDFTKSYWTPLTNR